MLPSFSFTNKKMDYQQAIKVISECQIFANQCSIGNTEAKVTTIKTLVGMLSKKLPDDLDQILKRYGTLDGYIVTAKLELNRENIELMFEWDFEVMTQALYQARQLPTIQHDGSSLFVVEKNISARPQFQSELEKEIIQLTKVIDILLIYKKVIKK